MTWAWRWRCLKVEEGVGDHPGHRKTEAVGQEVAVVEGEAAYSHCLAVAAEVGARWHIRLPEGAVVVAGQQTRGEEGKKGVRVVVEFPGMGSPWEVVEGRRFPAVVVVEVAPEGEQSLAWLLRGIRSEELVVGDLG